MENSRNDTVRKIYIKCCSWGKKMVIADPNYIGGPVPFYRNPSKKWFKSLAIINVVFTLLTTLLGGVQWIVNNSVAKQRAHEY